MRFYEVNDGNILIDGISSVDMTRKDLSQNFGGITRYVAFWWNDC